MSEMKDAFRARRQPRYVPGTATLLQSRNCYGVIAWYINVNLTVVAAVSPAVASAQTSAAVLESSPSLDVIVDDRDSVGDDRKRCCPCVLMSVFSISRQQAFGDGVIPRLQEAVAGAKQDLM